MSDSDVLVEEDTDVVIEKPKDYNVIFHNDDKTTFWFVTSALMQIFAKSETEAQKLTIKIHHEGKAVVAVYPKEIAVEKADLTMRAAAMYGFPLKVTAEPE